LPGMKFQGSNQNTGNLSMKTYHDGTNLNWPPGAGPALSIMHGDTKTVLLND